MVWWFDLYRQLWLFNTSSHRRFLLLTQANSGVALTSIRSTGLGYMIIVFTSSIVRPILALWCHLLILLSITVFLRMLWTLRGTAKSTTILGLFGTLRHLLIIRPRLIRCIARIRPLTTILLLRWSHALLWSFLSQIASLRA
jgi:hypothetical protein